MYYYIKKSYQNTENLNINIHSQKYSQKLRKDFNILLI